MSTIDTPPPPPPPSSSSSSTPAPMETHHATRVAHVAYVVFGDLSQGLKDSLGKGPLNEAQTKELMGAVGEDPNQPTTAMICYGCEPYMAGHLRRAAPADQPVDGQHIPVLPRALAVAAQQPMNGIGANGGDLTAVWCVVGGVCMVVIVVLAAMAGVAAGRSSRRARTEEAKASWMEQA